VRSPRSLAGCKIHVWDVGQDVAPKLGMSACNITDVWPFDHPGSGIAGMRRTAHMDAPHAAGYWLSNAVRMSPYYESNIDKADLVLLDTYVCRNMVMRYVMHCEFKKYQYDADTATSPGTLSSNI